MATVRLQRRIHRPPRHRLRATGNGPRTRGHALPAPRPSRHSAPVLKHRGPETAASLPARSAEHAASPRTSMAPHTSSAAKVSPRGAEGQKPLSKLARSSGAGPARLSARRPPRAPAGPARAHAALCFLSSRALPTCSIKDVGLFLTGETLDERPGEGSGPRAPRARGLSPRPPLSSKPI